MTEPTVCAVMLTADRPELARRAVDCFRRQTHPAKRLYVFDSGETPDIDCLPQNFTELSIAYHRSVSGGHRATAKPGLTIGELRNLANGWCAADGNSDVLIHWDSDDFSHPNRIAEQVALLQSSGADVVGFNEMLFWRQDPNGMDALSEAWLYSNPDPRYCLGTSLCYWRKTWERKPFEATSQGEDLKFWTGLKSIGVSSLFPAYPPIHPCMIARIHSGPNGNTSIMYRPDLMRAIERQGGEWKRVPKWDSYCATMEEK